MGFGDTASSQGYAAAAAAGAGAPFYAPSGIYFGDSNIGPATLSNTPSYSPSASAVPSAAQAEHGGASAGAGASPGPGAGTGTSGFVWPVIIVGAVLGAGLILVHILKTKG